MARRAQDHQDYIQKLGPGLAHITHFLAVYSCKGGVGKSTIAVNLAYELARMGGRVGLLDVDIYGPSLPVLIHPDDAAVHPSPMGRGMIYPIHHRGVKVMSLGYVSPGSGVPGSGPQGGAAVMRGPMAGKVVAQLLKGTDWGELDVLVLDLPPGTGDVQLAVCQDLQLSGAVAVTTPSKLALSDAKKGIEMFTSLGVPTLAAVENMAYFVCDGGGRHYPFGKGEALLDDSSTTSIFQLPISTATNDANDAGSPLCLDRPAAATEELAVFTDLAHAISKELLLVQHNRTTTTGHDVDTPHRVSFQGNTKVLFDVASTYLAVANDNQGFVARFFSENGATEIAIAGTTLRERDPKTGNVGGNSGDGMVQHHVAKPPLLFPAKVERKGRYGYAVEYADGQIIIYSMIAIAKAAGGIPAER
jgi:Mrp family chromosome partitioning ATPase